jgi:hypothetical protein
VAVASGKSNAHGLCDGRADHGAETDGADMGGHVKLSGFWSFVVADKAPRVDRNPQTGGEIMIAARKVVRFKASQVSRGELNGRGWWRCGSISAARSRGSRVFTPSPS